MADTVDIAVRWSEAGQDIPAKTRASLQALSASTAETAATVGDRLAKAFSDVERREPTYAVRRLRFAMDELTASALGIAGPFGRVIATLGMMQFGGAIAGVGGLVVAIKDMVEFSGQLDQALEKLNTRFATLGGPGAVSLAGAANLRNMEPAQPSWVLRLMARIGDPLPGMEGDLSQAIEEGFGAEQATTATAAMLTMGQFHRQHAEVIKRHGEQLRHEELKRIGLESPERAIADLLGNRQRFRAMGAEAAAEWAKAYLEVLKQSDIGVTTRERIRLAPLGTLGGGLTPIQGFDFRGPGEAFLAAHAPMRAFPEFGAFRPLTDRPIGSEKAEERAERVAERNAEKMAMVIGREIGPIIALMAGGGARGAVAGLGGISATLASLNDPNSGKALLGKAAPWLDLGSGLLSGASSLFSGGQKPKVIITAFEEQAARQIKELRGDPATTQIIVIGGDVRSLQQQLGRLGRAGVITRFP